MNIKRIMALLLALIMTLSLVVMGFQVLAAEEATTPDVDVDTGEDDDLVVDFGDLVNALGTANNPINVETPDQLTSVVVKAGGEVYYAISSQLNGMILTIVGDENITVTLNDTVLTADEDGLFQVELTGTPANKLVVANAGAKDVETVAAIEYPVGSEYNPIVVNSVGEMVSPAVGAGKTVYMLINASLNGKLLNVEAAEGVTVVVNRTTPEAVDGTYTVELTGMPTNRVVITNAGETDIAALFATITEKPGSEANPLRLNAGENTVTVAAGETVYYQGRFGGMTMTVGEGLTVVHNGTTYAAGETFTCVQTSPYEPCKFAVSAAADTTSTLTINYPLGSMNNPATLVIGENTASIEAGNNQGYFFTWTATEDGTLTITMPAGDWTYSVSNLTSGVTGDTQWSDSDPVVNPATVTVAAGDQIQIMVNSYDPNNMWSNPAADLVITAAFEKKVEIVKFKLTGANMTLGNELAMNFFMSEGYNTEGVYAVITKTYADGRPDKVVETTFGPSGYAGLVSVTFNGLAAKEMADKITVVVYNADGDQISEVWEDSVKSYCMRKFPDATKETDKTMYVEMLNYGAAAQVEFKYDTENLANADMTDAMKACGLESVELENTRVEGNSAGANLTLASKIELNVYFQGSVMTEDTYAKITFVDHYGKTKEYRVESNAYGTLNSLKYVAVNQIALADSFSMVTVEICNADGEVVASCSDSVESYAARKSTGDDLFMAIAKFAQAAYNYFHTKA